MRSNYNGEITEKNLGENVKLFGWVNKVRDHGGLIFIDLRDISGIVQLVIEPESPYYDLASTIHNEYVLGVEGKVILREKPNPQMVTGMIEVDVTSLTIINKSKPMPIDEDSNDEIRLKYRYLDLRRLDMQNIFKIKAKTLSVVRNYLAENNFIECETPILCKSTPEGARDFLVPSREYNGEFYALPQSPQILKQLLMVGGFDRYYQIAKCFRDEDLRADRQPEFSQIDIETSFLDQDELLTIIEGMIKRVWKEILGKELVTPFPRLKWDDAISRYGSDKPDTRFGLELNHLENVFKSIDTPLFNNKTIVGIKINDKGNLYTRKRLDGLVEYTKKHGGENLLYVRYQNQEFSGSITKLLNEEVKSLLEMSEGDLFFITTGSNYTETCEAMGSLRNKLGEDLGIIDKSYYDFKWVVEFPLFDLTDEGEITSSHHPFTRPLKEHESFLLTDPLKVYSYSYDLVSCGYEVGGGSLRIFDLDIQQKVFEVLKISSEQQRSKFGYLLDAMEYGCPPHGGLAFGVERLIMILVGTDNIRDVILFPKTTTAQDLMLDSPSEVDENQLDDLGITKKFKK